MISLKDFLLNNDIKFGTYSLVCYDGKTVPLWFTKHTDEEGICFLESPCELYKIADVEGDTSEFAKMYASELVEEVDANSYVNDYVLPMIVEGYLQCLKMT